MSDYDASKAFYEKALALLGIRVLMEPVPEVGGFGDDLPFFWIGRRDRGPDSGVHVAFTAADRETVDAFHAAALAAGGSDNGEPGRPRDLPPALLRGLRARPRRQQRRGRLPHARLMGVSGGWVGPRGGLGSSEGGWGPRGSGTLASALHGHEGVGPSGRVRSWCTGNFVSGRFVGPVGRCPSFESFSA